MRQITVRCGILFFVIMQILSCQKEFTQEEVPPNPLLPDSNYLSTMYVIDISASTQDTVSKFVYTYDSQRRVVRFLESSFYPFSTDTAYRDFHYFYHNNDTLPYRLVFLSNDGGLSPGLDTSMQTYFYYDAAGKRVKDSIIGSSVISFGFSGVANYIYQGDKIICHKTDSIFDVSSGTWSYEVNKDTATVLNSNLIKNSYWSDNSYHTETDFTYDNHPSPFAKLSNFKTWAMMNIEEIYFYEIPQKNNIIKLKTNEYFNGMLTDVYESDFSGSFLYNAAGYPLQMVDAIANEKIIFVYRSL